MKRACSSRMTTNTQNTTDQTNSTAPAAKSKQAEVGALWKRQSQKGQKYLAGTIKYDEMGQKTEMKVVVFPVDNKTNPKSPDFRIYLSNATGKPSTTSEAGVSNVVSKTPGGPTNVAKVEDEEEVL